jgi:RNA polymerase sigma-70 factor, ECF subfamily
MIKQLQEHIYTDDSTLVERCKNGDALAQKLVYENNVKCLMIICLRYIKNKQDAHEVLMDSFCNCFKMIGGFQYLGSGSLQAWLKKIAVNQCLMFLRKKSIDFKELDEKIEYRLPIESTEHIIDQMSAKEIIQLIEDLPTGYRTVFNLYVFEDMPHKEIARSLNISENTSKSQLHKARMLLQKKIVQSQSVML